MAICKGVTTLGTGDLLVCGSWFPPGNARPYQGVMKPSIVRLQGQLFAWREYLEDGTPLDVRGYLRGQTPAIYNYF